MEVIEIKYKFFLKENRCNNYYPDRFCLKQGVMEVIEIKYKFFLKENRYNNYYPDRFCLKQGIIEISRS